jgi:uncharacterized protein
MNRRDAVLAVLAAADGNGYGPAQLQKALFLISRNAPDVFDDERGFNFTPYDYGPFDKRVYDAADELASEGLCNVTRSSNGYRTYSATEDGRRAGQQVLAGLDASKRDYILEVSRWVRSLSFAQLVKSIYQAYPETRKNSIFVG